MLATPERVQGAMVFIESVMWHKPVGRREDEARVQAIACSDKGIIYPAPKRDIPLDLNKPGESWCPDCLARTRS
ncbi:hypothetical protein AB0933_32480 [Streptomyces venezuelae]|uniref:hypothetical protein n=1 Tax=Streptomyces venezuelae TaxID=54571 RepID=UPI00345383CF